MLLRRFSRRSPHTSVRALAGALALALSAAFPVEAAASTWPVEYAQGDFQYTAVHRNLTLEVNGRAVRVLRGEEVLRTFEPGSILAVLYDRAVYHPVIAYYSAAGTNMPTLAPPGPDFASDVMTVGLFFVVVPLLLAPIANTQHFVTLAWKDGDHTRSATLQMKDNDRGDVLAALSTATGLPWRDAPAERAKVAADFETAKSTAFAFDLDREVSVAGTYLDKGKHTGVLVGSAEATRLILFRGNASQLQDALLSTPVRVEQRAASGGAPETAGAAAASTRKKKPEPVAEVSFRDTVDAAAIKELHVGERTLTFPEYDVLPPGTPHPVGDGRTVEISWGQYGTGTITRTELEGEPAFGFRVNKLQGTFSAHRSVVITADLTISSRRVVFDPGDDAASAKHRIVIERSSITEAGNGPLNTRTGLGLTTDEKTYHFIMLAPGHNTGLHPKRQSLVLTRIADFARLAVRDFDAASTLFDGWLAGIPTLAPTGDPGETEAPEQTDAQTP